MSFLLTVLGLALVLLAAYGYLCHRLWRRGGIHRKVALVLVVVLVLSVAYEQYVMRFPSSFFLTILGLALVLLAAYGYLCHRLWRRGGIHRKVALLLVLLPVITVAYEEYITRFPRESFYREEFEKIAGRDLPPSARFIFKQASYPDFHGDYGACAVVQLSRHDYEVLLAYARTRRSQEDTVRAQGCDLEDHLRGATFAAEIWSHRREDESMLWALVAGQPLLVFSYSSW